MLTRMTAFSKNTIRLQPQTKSTYNPQDTITFRLPASALLDMASMTLKFDFVVSETGGNNYPVGTNVVAAPPKFTSGFFRRVDVSMGATSVGLTGLHDYGCLSTLLYNHCVPTDSARQDGNWVEAQGDVPFQDYVFGAAGAIGVNQRTEAGVQKGRWTLSKGDTRSHSCMLRNYLGLMGGTYFRLLDTNLLPEVTVSFTLGPQWVIPCSDISRVSWTIQNVSLSFESLNFGDGVYRSMVDQRLATGDLVLPFVNFVGFEGNQQTGSGTADGGQTSITQFTVATKSLNGVMATFRRGQYDSSRPTPRGTDIDTTTNKPKSYSYNTMVKTQSVASQVLAPQSDYYQCFCGHDVYGMNVGTMTPDGTFDVVSATGANQRYGSDVIYDNYNPAQAPAQRWVDNGTVGAKSPSYQFTIDSKLYPQFLGNAIDSAMLVKNFFDNGGLNLSVAGSIPTLKDFLGYAWMFAIGLDHHSDDQRKNKIVSGLDTRNSQIPITFTANNLPGAETLRPTIFAAMTSVLVIGPDRIISTVL
jgi:hypothetical protein